MLILGVDPGKTTGVAVLQTNPWEVISIEEVDESHFSQKMWALIRASERVACEDFILRPGKSDFMQGRWTILSTVKLIGRIEALCWAARKPLTIQQPAIKPTGYKLAGATYQKGKKGTHMLDGLAHAAYLAHTLGETKHKLRSRK